MCVCMHAQLLNCIRLSATPWAVVWQAPESRQEHWNGLPFYFPENFPYSEIQIESPTSPALQVDSLTAEPSGKPFTDSGA